MEYKVIRTEDDFLLEKENWEILYNCCSDATPFQSWDWCYCWVKNMKETSHLFIIKAFESKNILGYAPLIINNGMAEFIGGCDIDYGRFLVKDNTVKIIHGFLDVVRNEGFGLGLQEMATTNPQIHAVQKCLENEKTFLKRNTTRTSGVELCKYPTFESYMSVLTNNQRRAIKRKIKENVIYGQEVFSDKLFDEMQEVFRDRQEFRGGDKSLAWAKPILLDMSKAGRAVIYTARCEEKLICYCVVLRDQKTQYTWLIAHLSQYEKVSPGLVMYYFILKDTHQNGFRYLDFMRGDYDYKMSWNVELNTNYTVYVYPTWGQYFKNKFWFWIRPKLKKIVYSNEQLKRFYKKHAK